jgi:hypothetical protein
VPSRIAQSGGVCGGALSTISGFQRDFCSLAGNAGGFVILKKLSRSCLRQQSTLVFDDGLATRVHVLPTPDFPTSQVRSSLT